MTPRSIIGFAAAWLVACSETPHEGVKLMPRAAPTTAAVAPAAVPSVAGVATGVAAGSATASAPASWPAAALGPVGAPTAAARTAALPGQLEGDAAPSPVLPGEPTGNERFREAVQQRLERRAANP